MRSWNDEAVHIWVKDWEEDWLHSVRYTVTGSVSRQEVGEKSIRRARLTLNKAREEARSLYRCGENDIFLHAVKKGMIVKAWKFQPSEEDVLDRVDRQLKDLNPIEALRRTIAASVQVPAEYLFGEKPTE